MSEVTIIWHLQIKGLLWSDYETLIIHPEDPATFISQIYAQLANKTVIESEITKSILLELIESHDRILMLGHSSQYGLLNSSQFPETSVSL